jgi:Ca-activated chloride channel homolog
MVEMSTVRTLCKTGFEFYERFLLALFGEYKLRPICHLAGSEPDSNESVIPDPRRSKSSAVMSLMLPLRSCLALLMLLTVREVEAQKAVNAPRFHTSVEMVLVPVTVTDHNGSTVEGLRADDFNIFDDRKPQKIVSFSSDDAPCSVALVLDISGSMQQTLSGAKEIAQAFFGSANPDDEFLLLTVSTQPAAMPAFTTDIAALEESIGFAKPGGLTALFDTVYLGLSRMREAQWPRRALLILSDGVDNHSRYSEKDLMSVALEADVQIYTIVVDNGLAGLGTSITPYRPALIKKPWDRAGERYGPEMLEKLSDQTGGLYFRVRNTDQAKADAIKAGRALRNEYVIGYRPPDSGTSERWHRISVKSKASNVHVHARNGYYSVEDASRSLTGVTPQ